MIEDKIKDYLDSRGVKYSCIVSSKPKCFLELPFNVSNAMNTGIILSTKEVVVCLQDYQWLEPDSLEKIIQHEDKLNNGYCIVHPARTWECSNIRHNDGLISVWDKEWSGFPTQNSCTERSPWIPEAWEFAYTAYPYDLLLKINGWPEYLDCDSSHDHNGMMNWINDSGYKPCVDKNNFMHAINHREWQPLEMWHQAKRRTNIYAPFYRRNNTFDLSKLERGKPYWKINEGDIYARV